MPGDQIGKGKFCSNCGRERYYAKGLCDACYRHQRKIERGEPVGQQWRVWEKTLSDEERLARRREANKRWYEAHKDQHPARRSAYRAKPGVREAEREKSRLWREANPEKSREIQRAWRERNVEAERERRSRYYQANKAAINLAKREARAAHPEKERIRAEFRQLKERNLLVNFLVDRDGPNCGICGKPIMLGQVSIDHKLQLANGGTHDVDNLRLAHLSCNVRRGQGVDAI